MKDFSYYSAPKEVKYFGFEEEQAYAKSLRDEINNKPMTAKEREDALNDVKHRVRVYIQEKNLPYNNALYALEQEFWKDARAELGYGDFLNDTGISLLEQKAYQDGHSSGFCEIFYYLSDLVDFCRELAEKGIKT